MSRWKWISNPAGGTYRDIGVDKDGSVWNPNGYPEDLVRAAVGAAAERRRERRSIAAKRAAQTRQRRKERRVYEVVARLEGGGVLHPGINCEICGRGLDDPQSKARGIGSDCWQLVLASIEQA